MNRLIVKPTDWSGWGRINEKWEKYFLISAEFMQGGFQVLVDLIGCIVKDVRAQ